MLTKLWRSSINRTRRKLTFADFGSRSRFGDGRCYQAEQQRGGCSGGQRHRPARRLPAGDDDVVRFRRHRRRSSSDVTRAGLGVRFFGRLHAPYSADHTLDRTEDDDGGNSPDSRGTAFVGVAPLALAAVRIRKVVERCDLLRQSRRTFAGQSPTRASAAHSGLWTLVVRRRNARLLSRRACRRMLSGVCVSRNGTRLSTTGQTVLPTPTDSV